MALVSQTLKLEITPGGVPPKLNVTEYDENMQITVQLLQKGQPFLIPSGVTAKVKGSYSGRYPFSENATVDGSTVTFELTKGMTAYAGRAWTKIKLTKDSKPVSTCGFWLECDRAGVEAGAVIQDSGFQEQINQGVAAYFDNDPPFFELPEGGQRGQALLSDGADSAYWGKAQDGTGFAATAKRLLLELLRKCIYTEDVEELLSDFEEALNLGVTQDGKKLIIESGVTVTKSGNVLLVS